MIYNKPKDFIFRVPDPKKTEKQSKKEKRKNKKYNIDAENADKEKHIHTIV